MQLNMNLWTINNISFLHGFYFNSSISFCIDHSHNGLWTKIVSHTYTFLSNVLLIMMLSTLTRSKIDNKLILRVWYYSNTPDHIIFLGWISWERKNSDFWARKDIECLELLGLFRVCLVVNNAEINANNEAWPVKLHREAKTLPRLPVYYFLRFHEGETFYSVLGQ